MKERRRKNHLTPVLSKVLSCIFLAVQCCSLTEHFVLVPGGKNWRKCVRLPSVLIEWVQLLWEQQTSVLNNSLQQQKYMSAQGLHQTLYVWRGVLRYPPPPHIQGQSQVCKNEWTMNEINYKVGLLWMKPIYVLTLQLIQWNPFQMHFR